MKLPEEQFVHFSSRKPRKIWLSLIFAVAALLSLACGVSDAQAETKVDWAVTNIPDSQCHRETLGSTDSSNNYKYMVELDSQGASVSKLQFTDAAAGDNELLSIVERGKSRYLPLATRNMRICVNNKNVDMPLSSYRWQMGEKIVTVDSESLSFIFEATRNNQRAIRITKTYTLNTNEYSLMITLKIENLYTEPLAVMIDQAGPTGMRQISQAGKAGAFWARLGTDGKSINISAESDTDANFNDRAIKKPTFIGRSDTSEPVIWIGQGNDKFRSVMYLENANKGNLVASDAMAEFYHFPGVTSDNTRTHVTGVWVGVKNQYPGMTLDAGQVKTITFDVYTGPLEKNQDIKNSDKGALYAKLGYFNLGELTGANASANTKHYIGSVNAETEYKYQIEAVNKGASIFTVKLSEHQITVKDKNLYNQDPARFQEEWEKRKDQGYRGPYRILNPVSDNGNDYLSMSSGKIYISCPDEAWAKQHDMSKDIWQRVDNKNSSDGQAEEIRFENILSFGSTEVVKVTKTYTLRKKDYSFDLTLKVENLYPAQLFVSIDQAGPSGVPREGLRDDLRQATVGKIIKDSGKIDAIRRLKKEKKIEAATLGKFDSLGRSDESEPIVWIGSSNKFFGCQMYLKPKEEDASLSAISARAEYFVAAVKENSQSRVYATFVRIGGVIENGQVVPQVALASGASNEWTFDVFAGPKRRDIINNADKYPLYKDLNYLKMIDTDRSCCSWMVIDSVVFGMMWLMSFLHAYPALGNYGLAIILLVLIVRLILHPLSKKSQVSMREMGKMGPEMKKLEEKHANDKATLQKEKMKLFRKTGFSPIIGCLPMFLQMPIWIALWTSIQLYVELRHAAFLPIWLTDLAAPDALFALPFTIPFVDVSFFNLLPILLGFAMLLQMKLNPQMGGSAAATTPQAAQQQKMMKILMPIMMVFIFYKAPSGLTLYIMASTFAGVIEAKVIRKHVEKKEAQQAAREVVVQGPGKSPRDSRPKKGKGPFWMKGK